jgi:hypothetical protein
LSRPLVGEEQGEETQVPWAKARDDQRGFQIEDALAAALGYGVVSGGEIQDEGGLAVSLAAGTVLLYGYVRHEVAEDVPYNDAANGATNTIWGRIVRTTPVQNEASRTVASTWDVELAHTTDDSEPAEDGGMPWIRLAFVTTAGADIVGRHQGPPGKNVRLLDPIRAGRTTIAADEVSIVEANESLLVPGPLTINGVLWVHGKVTVL